MWRRGVAVLAAVILVAAGCGGSHRPSGSPPPRGLSAADRTALLEIATDSGTLRLNAAPASLGLHRPVDRTSIAGAHRRLGRLRTADPDLGRLRTELSAAFAAVLASPQLTRAVARRAVSATDSVNAGLRRYAAKHPAVAGLIPD